MHDRVIGDLESALTRCVRGLLFVLLTCIVATVDAAVPLSSAARAEIEGLMSRLEASGCEFNRNGTWYTAAEAASHLQRKAKYLEDSGMVESACKQFRARLAGSGMRWSRSGLERLLPIRAAIMSQRFDDLWQKAYHLPLN